jgi:hypothetical protein
MSTKLRLEQIPKEISKWPEPPLAHFDRNCLGKAGAQVGRRGPPPLLGSLAVFLSRPSPKGIGLPPRLARVPGRCTISEIYFGICSKRPAMPFEANRLRRRDDVCGQRTLGAHAPESLPAATLLLGCMRIPLSVRKSDELRRMVSGRRAGSRRDSPLQPATASSENKPPIPIAGCLTSSSRHVLDNAGASTPRRVAPQN